MLPNQQTSISNSISLNGLAGKIDYNLLFAISIPFILLLANNEWLFPHGNPSDAWNNNSYFFVDGDDYPPLYTIYKATRLSWILKGIFVHKLFEPLTAYYVLHLSMFVIWQTTFYLLAKNLFNKHVAVLGAIAFGTYSQFHSVISFEWDYQTHDGVTNMLLAMLFLVYAAKGGAWRMWLVLAGFAFASAVQSTYIGTYVPTLGFWYLYLNHKHEKHPIGTSIFYIVTGGLLATLFYCIISYLLGGPFFFFLTLIVPILEFGFSGGYNFHPGYWFSLAHVLQNTKGLVIPLFATAFAIILLTLVYFKRHKGPLVTAITVCTVSLLIASATHVGSHFLGHGHLGVEHFLAHMAPFVFLTLTSIYAYFLRVSGMTLPSNKSVALWLKIAVLAIFSGGLIFSIKVHSELQKFFPIFEETLALPDKFRSWTSITTLELLILVLFLAMTVGILLSRKHWARAVIPVFALSIFLSLTNVKNSSIPNSYYAWNYRCGYLKDHYLAIIDAHTKLRKYDPEYTLRLWYRNNEKISHPDPGCDERLGRLIGAAKIDLTALYGAVWGFRFYSFLPLLDEVLIKYGFPARNPNLDYYGLVDGYLATASFSQISKRKRDRTPDTYRAAILSGNVADHKQALDTLRSYGLKAVVLGREKISQGKILFDMTIVNVRKDDRLSAKARR